MSPNPPRASKKLSYPLYGAAFDPLNQDFLVVGGGGGSTSSGVPNKLSLLDASRFTELNEIADLELARDEDSPTSLAVVNSTPASLIAYAGINASIREQDRGRNEHLRSFRIGLPSRKRNADGQEKQGAAGTPAASVRSEALSRAALFRAANGPKNEAYQRVLRVSQAGSDGDQIAAIASGLAPENEVIVFRATDRPGLQDVLSRVSLEKLEASDLDIATSDETDQHILAICTDIELYLQRIPKNGKNVPEPAVAHGEAPRGSKIRAVRWLTSRYLVLLRNLPGRTGAELVVLKTDKDYTSAIVILKKQLPKSTKQAVGLDACALSKSSVGDQQFIVAVAGQDGSVETLTINWHDTVGMDKFRRYMYSPAVHAGPITCVAFSKFISPSLPVSKDTRPQYIRLATVGVDQTVTVTTLPLRPYPTTTKTPRYVLKSPSETYQNAINIFVALLVVAITAFFTQAFFEIRGATPPVLNAQTWLPPSWQARFAHPFEHGIPGPVIPESMPPVIHTATSSLSSALESTTDAVKAAIDAAAESGDSILHHLVNSPDTLNKAIVIRDSSDAELSTEVHEHGSDPVKDETLRKWEQLNEKEKKGWLKRLKDAGHWTENQGESVLKGILFSEIGGAVAAALRG